VSARSVASLSEDEIQINGVVLNVRDPQAALSRLPKALVLDGASQAAAGSGFYLVKMRGVSRTQVEVDALERAGAILGEYLNVNTYIAKINSSDLEAVKRLPFVTYVGDYQPAYKINPKIGLEQIPVDMAIDAATGAEMPWLLEVVLHKGATVNEVLGQFAGLSMFPQHEDITDTPEMSVVLVRTAPQFIPMISQIPGVKWITERPYYRLTASASSPTVNPMILQNNGVFTTNTVTGWKLWNTGLDGNLSGTAQIVTMMDSGLNTSAYHFSQDTVNAGTLGAAHRKVVGYDVYGGDACVNNFTTADGGHGTETSQHAVGSISNMSANPDVVHTPNVNWDNGIARDGKVYFQDIGIASGALNPPIDLGPSIVAAVGKGSFIQNHSWGAPNNSYSTTASFLDTALVNNPNVIVTASAGNQGVAGPNTTDDVCTGKNVICVGGTDPGSPNSLFESCLWDGNVACTANADLGSGRGPVATSGRVKPDILAYMANWNSVGGEFEAINRSHAMCQTDGTKTPYWDFVNNSQVGGTSFSAPEVAGLGALVRDYFLSGFYPTGTATPANAVTPSGTLVKAMLLASGEDMGTISWPTTDFAIAKRYSSDVGYGRANLPSVLHVGSGAPFLWVQNNDNLGDGSTKTTFYNINGNGSPVRIMLVWYDAAGNALQKDIDLKVTIGANIYFGNRLTSGWSATGGTADHLNTTEGFFLDAAHGLPASGQIRVDVIGFNNPAGINYSLVVVGDVASSAVTQVSLDKGKYDCNDVIEVTVNDASASSPVQATLTSRDASSTIIDTQIVNCTGSNGVFSGTITANAGINVADGGTVTATYAAVTPAVSNVVCKLTAADGGFLINGGCDNNSAGTNSVTGPLFNGGSNEFYAKYMDAGEASSYTFGFVNQTGAPLADVYVSLSFSGAGASKMTVLNNPVHVGYVPTDGLAGAVFQVQTDPTTVGLTSVNMDFDITSPPDGFTVPRRLTQVQLLQSNDTVLRQASCSLFSTNNFSPWFEATITGANPNPWRATLAATTPATVGAELRTDGACNNNTANGSVMTGNSGTGSNFASNADSFLMLNFQPALRGNGPSGQPYRYTWKWHSFYRAAEATGNQSGVWGAFYNNAWNSAVNPTGDQAAGFTLAFAYYYHTLFDYPIGSTGTSWNWEALNTGTPDNPNLNSTTVPASAPNQFIINFGGGINGLATNSTYFAYGHEHADAYWFVGTHATLFRDVALDNDRLVYDEYYTSSQAGASCGGGGQVGQVAFDRYNYANCPNSTAVISVTDANAVSPITAVVTSPGTGDSETVTLTGTAPYFSGTIPISTNSGGGSNNGTLLVLPSENLLVSYTDTAPAGTSTATAAVACAGGNVVYVSNAQISDNGDNDGIPDNNETVTIDITVKNNLPTPLTNAKVKIYSTNANIDCISDDSANYGTIGAGASATNPGGDRFTFHVAAAVACADWQSPPKGQIKVLITGDGIDGAAVSQGYVLDLDLDNQVGGTYNYSQNFASDPGWATSATPDDDGGIFCSEEPAWANNFHWCAACGNSGAGYGAWVGNSPFGTAGQNYVNSDSSTLYSPTFTAAGNVGLNFQIAYRTELTWDGAIAQYEINNSGTWTTLPFTTPPQAATTASQCTPLPDAVQGWTGTSTGTAWTTTNTATVPSSSGQLVRFRWRLGSDSSVTGSSYGGLGVDNVNITNLLQTQVCEPTRNTGLPPCVPNCSTLPNGSACDDNNACTQTDTCSGGACVGSNPVAAPGDVGSTVTVSRTGTDANLSWSVAANATTSDVLRGNLSALPVGPGGGDEVCFNGIAGSSTTDPAVPASGTGYWYLIRGENACNPPGTYGTQGVNGSPGVARSSTTCP
jgi:hypothetical protein